MDSEEASVRVVLACGQTSMWKDSVLGSRSTCESPGTGRVRQFPGGDTEENTDIKGLLTETLADLATVSRNRT